jgi:cysteinyl-tRNA synthetase
MLQVEGPADAAERLPLNTVERLQNDLGPLVQLDGDAVEAVIEVIEARQLAKMQRDFGLADRFRDALKNLGIVVTDVKKDRVSWTVVGG